MIDLDHVKEDLEFKRANAGFLYDYQLINVNEGIGETAPMPYFYQNLAEAEYVLATYKYMRTLGYPNEKITILTTYNGQKQLLREIFERHCTSDAFLGRPSRITTVDKFQGQQNDFVLLSLVRTRTIGHLRDVRRLVVAMSRARLGLYVFGKVGLFAGCFELQKSMHLFLSRPQELCLMGDNETYPTERLLLKEKDGAKSSILPLKSLSEFQSLINERYTRFMETQTKLMKKREDEFTEEPELAGHEDGS